MLNDLPGNIETLDNLDVSHFDPMLKDYVFSSFFLARLVNKTIDENKKLKLENATLKAQLEECSELRKKVEALKAYIDSIGDMSTDTVFTAEFEPQHEKTASSDKGFIAQNCENLKTMLEQDAKEEVIVTSSEPAVTEVIPEAVPEPEPIVEPVSEPVPIVEAVPEVIPEPAVEAVSKPEPVVEAIPEPVPEPEPVVEAIPEPVPEPEPVVEAIPEPVPEPEPVIEAIPEPAPVVEMPSDPNAALTPEQIAALIAAQSASEPATEAVPEPIVEDIPEPEPIAEPIPEPVPAPAVEMPSDPNAPLTPEQIAALIAAQSAPEPIAEEIPEPAPVVEPVPEIAPAVEIPSDPNAALTPEQIAALFAANS